MYDHTFSKLAIHQIRHHVTKLAISLVIAYGHFNLPQGYVGVNILTLSPIFKCYHHTMKLQ